MLARLRHGTRGNDRKGLTLLLLVQIAHGRDDPVTEHETQQESEYAR